MSSSPSVGPSGASAFPSVPSSEPSPEATPAATPSPPSSPLVPVYASWTPVAVPESLPHVYGGSSVVAAVAFGGGYVAVGGVSGGCCDGSFSTDTHGGVWRSTDGLAWTLESRAAVFNLAHLSGLATDGRTLVAVGARYLDSTVEPGNIDPHGAAWTSTDGRTWTRVTGIPWFTSIVRTGGTFVALTDQAVGPQVWRSVDGRSWSQVAGQAAFGPGSVAALAATLVGLVAVGWTGADPDSQAAVSWRSVDGVTWTRSPAQDSLDGASMIHLAVLGSTILAVGDHPDSAAAWWSTDGLTWTPTGDSIFGAPDMSLSALLRGSDGFVVTGSVMSQNAFAYLGWSSPDGRTWDSIQAPPSVTCAVERGAALTVFGQGFDPDMVRAIPVAWNVR